jgi:hypothetical protein
LCRLIIQIVDYCCNPTYATTFVLDYLFEELLSVRLEVFAAGDFVESLPRFGVPDTTAKAAELVSIGFVECTVGQILTEGRGTLTKVGAFAAHRLIAAAVERGNQRTGW